jgi:integrase
VQSIEKLRGWDKFTLYGNKERTKYVVRWWDAEKSRQCSRALKAGDLVSAREEALTVAGEVVSPIAYIHDTKDPPFGEIWPAWEAHRAEETTFERQVLLRSRWHNYYRDRLGSVRCSRIEDELKKFRTELLKHGKPWKEGVKTATGSLQPNTIQEIVDTAQRAVNYAIKKRLVTDVPGVDKIRVPGFQVPKDRNPKGRYVTFQEIGKLIDAAGHNLKEVLLECGTAARIGAISDMTVEQVYLRAGVVDLSVPGTQQTTKARPLVPISGPMWWILRERLARQVHDRHVILYQSEAITKKTRSQTMRRLREKAGLENANKVNWYSLRHTLSDCLYERVSAKARSMLFGHDDAFSNKEKRRLFGDGSAMSDIYRRETLAPLYEVAKVLDEQWWPEIQKHCQTDLRLSEADSQQMRLIYVSELNQYDSGA